MNTSKYLNIYYQNVRGVNTKTSEILLNSTLMSQYDLIILTETWLNSSSFDGEYFDVKLFNVLRKDRDFSTTAMRRGGGVLIAARKEIKVIMLELEQFYYRFAELKHIDIMWVKIKAEDLHQCLHIIVLYVPPSCGVDDYSILFESLMSVNVLYKSNIIVLGDFNIPEYISCYSSSVISSNIYYDCDNFSKFLGLSQKNFVLNSNERLLDLVFSNTECHVIHAEEVLTLEDAHHPALEVSVCLLKEKTTCIPIKTHGEFNFKKADFPSLYYHLSEVDFSFLDSAKDVDGAIELFYGKLLNIFNSFVPTKRQPLGTYPEWFDKEIIKSLKQKHKAWLKYKKDKSLLSLETFKLYRREIKKLIRDAYDRYLKRVTDEIKVNPKQFWTFVKHKTKKFGIPNIMQYDDTELTSPQNIVDAFADFFGKSFNSLSVSSTSMRENSLDSLYKNIIYLTEINEDEIRNAIKQLKPTLTAGPDCIQSFLIRDCASIFCRPLNIIFNLIIKKSYFPMKWKVSRVAPVHKKNSRSNIANYRPITIINNFAKYSKSYFILVSLITSPLTYLHLNMGLLRENPQSLIYS